MYVRQLQLTDFRSWNQVDLNLERGVNVLVGSNGQGKTNLVEALGYLATLSSHRVATDAPLVRVGTQRAIIRAAVVADEREMLVELEIQPGKSNRARLNRGAVGRARDVLGVLRTVLFAPEDIGLVRDEPGVRRRFLDELLTARWPRFAAVRADYERTVKQRNALLKSALSARRSSASYDVSTLEVWDKHLAHYGAELMAGRLDLVASLAPHVAAAYSSIADSGMDSAVHDGAGTEKNAQRNASVAYSSALAERLGAARVAAQLGTAGQPGGEAADVMQLSELLLEGLREVRSMELERGTSLVGPHRDDLDLVLGETPVKGYASHGESWSMALALRLASQAVFLEDGLRPVLILDDVFAELDQQRRNKLASVVASAEQVLVTAAVSADVPDALAGTRFSVAEGAVDRSLG